MEFANPREELLPDNNPRRQIAYGAGRVLPFQSALDFKLSMAVFLLMQASFLLGTCLHNLALQAKIKLFNEYENICSGTLLEDSKIHESAVFTREELGLLED